MWLYAGVEELPSRGVCGDSNPRTKGAHIAFYILCKRDLHIWEPGHFPQARDWGMPPPPAGIDWRPAGWEGSRNHSRSLLGITLICHCQGPSGTSFCCWSQVWWDTEALSHCVLPLSASHPLHPLFCPQSCLRSRGAVSWGWGPREGDPAPVEGPGKTARAEGQGPSGSECPCSQGTQQSQGTVLPTSQLSVNSHPFSWSVATPWNTWFLRQLGAGLSRLLLAYGLEMEGGKLLAPGWQCQHWLAVPVTTLRIWGFPGSAGGSAVMDYCICHGPGLRRVAKYLPFLACFLVPSFTVWCVSFQVGSVLEQNWSEQPQGVGRDPDARLLCVLHVALSILLQLGEKLT